MDSAVNFNKPSGNLPGGSACQTDLANDKLASSFLRTLIYFDIFSYPLTKDEILNYSACENIKADDGLMTLQSLLKLGAVNFSSGYYFIGDIDEKISRREAGNKLAVKRMKKARLFSAIIASFPFTRGVFISGSLSKGYMDKNSDIDYFIITSPNRLWLSRTLLIMFKKFFLLNSHRNFCINYLVDTSSLEIKDRNIYTATEVALLLPMYNYGLYEQFIYENRWVRKYFPNHMQTKGNQVTGIPVVKKIFEIMFNNRFGDFLDHFFYKTTTKYWARKHGKEVIESPDSDLYFDKHISQYNPMHFRPAVLARYQVKVAEFEIRWGINLGEL